MRLRPLLLVVGCVLLVASGCSHTRIEHYYPADQSPVMVQGQDLVASLVYFKQSQRHFYATVRLTNVGPGTIRIRRVGEHACPFTLEAMGQTYLALNPDPSFWTPWSGVVEQSRSEPGSLDLPTGTVGDVTMRFAFPSTVGSYTYDWTLTLSGLTRDGVDLAPIVVPAPTER